MRHERVERDFSPERKYPASALLYTISFVLLLFTASSSLPQVRQSATPAITYPPQLTADLKELQQAALASDYAYRQLAHLTDNIGPRLSGSAQAEKAVDYVASEMRSLGAEVQLEKLMVPHWVRGEETASLIEFPGMAAGTVQKLVVTALGGSM